MNKIIIEKANRYIRKRILETKKPFDEAELPKVFNIIILETKKEVFDDVEKILDTKNIKYSFFQLKKKQGEEDKEEK